jgi:hypothetical protein
LLEERTRGVSKSLATIEKQFTGEQNSIRSRECHVSRDPLSRKVPPDPIRRTRFVRETTAGGSAIMRAASDI